MVAAHVEPNLVTYNVLIAAHQVHLPPLSQAGWSECAAVCGLLLHVRKRRDAPQLLQARRGVVMSASAHARVLVEYSLPRAWFHHQGTVDRPKPLRHGSRGVSSACNSTVLTRAPASESSRRASSGMRRRRCWRRWRRAAWPQLLRVCGRMSGWRRAEPHASSAIGCQRGCRASTGTKTRGREGAGAASGAMQYADGGAPCVV
jgi:hypothetical protein